MINFSPGPSMLPDSVRARIADDWSEAVAAGHSVAEISHRGPLFKDLAERSEQRLRGLLGLGGEHRVLFMQGGANTQFVLLPMNFGAGRYIVTGHWGRKALDEARKLEPACACWASSNDDGGLEKPSGSAPGRQWAYTHITSNETIHGIQMRELPGWIRQGAPVVADMSSDIASYPVDFGRIGMAYAGAQKNLGIAGLTIVIMRADFLQQARAELPVMLNYREFAGRRSVFNTPPTFNWYVTDLVLAWIEEQGGVAALAEANRRKAALLYAVIDGGDFYRNPVRRELRSHMNVPFRCPDESLDALFCQEAKREGMFGLKGHRSIGGIRASIYNAMPLASVETLAGFMRDFGQRHG